MMMKHVLVGLLMATVSLMGADIGSAKDLIATWFMKDGPRMTIEMKDQDNFRMNMGEEGYILMSQGKGYMVSKEKGEWVATSMESMKKMMERSGIQDLMARMGKKHVRDEQPPRFEDTGRVETIAGITGKVYKVSMDDFMGKRETAEMVFANDPRLLRLHQAQARWAESAGRMGGRSGPSYSDLMKKYAKNGPEGALLRYDNVMKLEKIQETSLNNNRFRVPRIKEMDMGSMPDMRRRNPNQPRMPRPSETTDLEKQIEEMQRQAARDETESNEQSEPEQENLIKGVDSMLKGLSGIFGN